MQTKDMRADRLGAELQNRLRLWRANAGLTLKEVADLTGVSVPTLSRVERGERRLAPLTRVQVARRLGVDVGELFEPDPIDDEEPNQRAD